MSNTDVKKGEQKVWRKVRDMARFSKEERMSNYIPIRDVAIEHGVTTRTVRNWVAKGLLIAYKRNNHAVLIDERSLDNILTLVRSAKK
jgi:predicted transcriptional regulator